jgi:uncharacterized membrane protein YjgN (DUF898 family)
MNERVSSQRMPIVSNSRASAQRPHHLRIVFTGSGSEYFRIWIVNLLLMMLTLGLYYPWAKKRRLRHFHGNTRSAANCWTFTATPGRCSGAFIALCCCGPLGGGQISATAGSWRS